MLPVEVRNVLGQLDENQLSELNYLVVDRLRQFEAIRHKAAMWAMMPGDPVSWTHEGLTHFGHIDRLNQKTVSVIADNGHKWKVSPQLLSQVRHAQR